MTYQINVDNIPEESFCLLVRQGADRRCTVKNPQWVTDVVSNGVRLYLEDVMMQAGRHFADRVNPETMVGGTGRQTAMALAWAIGSMVRPSVVADALVVEDPGDPDVKRLCSEIFGVGLGLEMLRACQVIDARTLKKVAARFDFEAHGPNGGRLLRIEAKGTFNNVSSSKQRRSIADKIAALGEVKRYDRAVGIIASLWTADRQRIFDIEITDPEREPKEHFQDAVREVIRFYAHRFDEAVGNPEGVQDLLAIASDPALFADKTPRLLKNVGTTIRPSRHFWRVQLVAHSAGQAQRFLGAFWERHKLPVPLPLDTREGESAVAYMAVDARVLELIRERKFRELLSYKPSFSGVLSANGPGYRSIFQLDSYGVLRGLVVGDLPQTIDLDAEQDTV